MKTVCRVWLVSFIIFMIVLYNTLPKVFLLAFWYMPVTIGVTFCVVAFFCFIFSGTTGHRTLQP
jgi:hypothetical protein